MTTVYSPGFPHDRVRVAVLGVCVGLCSTVVPRVVRLATYPHPVCPFGAEPSVANTRTCVLGSVDCGLRQLSSTCVRTLPARRVAILLVIHTLVIPRSVPGVFLYS